MENILINKLVTHYVSIFQHFLLETHLEESLATVWRQRNKPDKQTCSF